LYDLLKSPFILNTAAVAYKERSTMELVAANSTYERLTLILNAYIHEVLERRHKANGYGDEKVIRWLSWLARWMGEQSILYPAWIQPSYLSSTVHSILVSVGVSVGCGLAVALLTAGLLQFVIPEGDDRVLQFSVLFGAVVGVVGYAPFIRPAEKLSWSWSALRRSIWSWMSFGLWWFGLLGLLIGLFSGYYLSEAERGFSTLMYRSIYGLVSGLVLGVCSGLFVGGITGLFSGLVVQSGDPSSPERSPSSGIEQSGRNGYAGGLRMGVVFSVLVFLWGLPSGVAIAVVTGAIAFVVAGSIAGLLTGGRAYLQHLALRALMAREDTAPWQYGDFLEYAVHLGLLRRAVAGYGFVHRFLQRHFALLGADGYSRTTTR
jgi:hypothetical protein